MAKRGAISVEITGDYKNRDVKRAIADLQLLQKDAGVTGGAMGRLGVAGVAMGAALGTAATAAVAAGARMAVQFGVDGVKAFLDDEAAAARLAKTMSNLGMEQATGAVEANIDALQRQTGVADDMLRPAMDRLLRSTGDVALATDTLKLAMDISAGTGKSLEAVVAALGRGFDGSTAGLSRLGAGLDAATLKSGDMRLITEKLAATFGGQAEVAATTYKGQLDRLAIGFSELQESFGAGFIGGLDKSTASTNDLMDAMKDLEPAMRDLGVTAGKAAVGLAKFATESVAVANSAVAMAEEPSWDQLILHIENTFLATDQFKGAIGSIPGVGKFLQGLYDIAAGFIAVDQASRQVPDFVDVGGGEFRNDPAKQFLILAEARRDSGRAARYAADEAAAEARANSQSGSSASAAEVEIVKLTKGQRNLALQMAGSQTALQQAKTDLDALREASAAYAASIEGAITGTVSLSDAFSAAQQASRDNTLAAGESIVSTTIASFRAQITAAKAFADSLVAVSGADGSQALIDQLVAIAGSEGPAAGAYLANELVAQGLVPQLSADLEAMNVFAGATGEAMASTFFDQGVVDAVALLNGLSAEVAAQEKQLERLGRNIGQPVADKISEEIARAIREGIADGRAAAATARVRAAAAEFTRVTSGASTPTAVPAAVFTGGGMINIPGRAEGGPVRAGSPYAVGEKGIELFVPGQSGTIVPNSALGGNTYQITVQAGVGDPRSIGQQVVEYITKFEKANGKVFAAA